MAQTSSRKRDDARRTALSRVVTAAIWQPASGQPAGQVLADKVVIVEFWVVAVNSIQFLALSGRQSLVRVKAPTSLHQTLPAQNFVQAGDTARELILRVKKDSICIRYLR